MVIYSWSTKKVKDGYRWNISKLTSLKNPNKQGHYVNTVVIKTGIRKTRAQAMGIGKKWKMYLTQQAKKRSK